MARRDLEEFAQIELARVYIAGRVAEADRVESALTRHGVDYAVEIEPYLKRILGLFTSHYSGVAFYVPSGQAAFARRALLDAGLTQGIADEQPFRSI